MASLFDTRLKAVRDELPPALRRVANFIDGNRVTALTSSALELAERAGASDATVVRTAQALGFEGLAELKQAIAAGLESRASPADNMRRTLAATGPRAANAIEEVFATHRRSIAALDSESVRGALAAAVSVLHAAEQIFVFGIGPSGPLACYAAILLGREGRQAYALDSAGIALADQLLRLRERDAVLVLTYGQPYPEVVAVVTEARRLGAPVVFVTDGPNHRLARRDDTLVRVARGRAGRVALHGATVVAIESLVIGLAASDQDRAITTLDRLNDLRAHFGKHFAGPDAGKGRRG